MFLFISLIQKSLLVSSFKETIELSSNRFYDDIIEGAEIKTYRLIKDDASSTFFKIEFASEPLSKKETYLAIAYEKNTDTPKYINDTDLILNKSYIEQGKRIIIVQQPNMQENSILILSERNRKN